MIKSDTIQLFHFVSYFPFSDFLILDFNKRKNLKIENILKIENMIQSDTIELYHFVSYFYFKKFSKKFLFKF